LLLVTGGAVLSAAGPEDEYKQRFRALAPDDLEGHYRLALWCKDQKAYGLLKAECKYLLSRNKDHEPARLLLELAERELGEGSEATSQPGDAQHQQPMPKLLNNEAIQTLRRCELQLDRPEVVGALFNNRVQERFLEEYGADLESKVRDRFFKLPASERAQLILRHAPDTLGPDVEITRNPARFEVFERKVLPIVLENCATSACHGPKGTTRWRIYTDRATTEKLVYTNYLIIHEFTAGGERLLDREFPARSTLISYGLPDEERLVDQPTRHPVAIQPPFAGRNDRKYREVLSWIESLSFPAPDYGIKLEPERSK